MIGRTFSLGFYQQFQGFQIGSFPSGEWFEELQTGRVGFYSDLYAFTVFCRGLVAGIIYGKAFGRQFYSCRFVEHYVFALFVLQFVLEGVESKVSGDGESGHDLGAGDKSVRAGKSVVAFGKVPVEGSDDRVLTVRVIDVTGPLTDTGSAGVGEHDATDLI